jgi:hypothetical protein
MIAKTMKANGRTKAVLLKILAKIKNAINKWLEDIKVLIGH